MDTSNREKIIFWGTPEFALPSLEALVLNGYRPVAVVTNPDEPVGRKQILTPPPVKVAAEKYGIAVFQPVSPRDPNFKKELPETDLFIVAAYGKIVPKGVLEIPKFGALNIHPSLLPRWRGPSPIQAAILNGDEETGVTIIKMDELMDHGPIVAVRRLEKESPRLRSGSKNVVPELVEGHTYKELRDELAKLGAELLVEILPKYLAEEITPTSQDESKATYSKILNKENGRIDWSQPAEKVERVVRAFNSWPGAWTVWTSGKGIFKIKIEEAELAGGPPAPQAAPGFVWSPGAARIIVKTGRGGLEIKKLTLEGKKSMAASEFLRGRSDFLGSILI